MPKGGLSARDVLAAEEEAEREQLRAIFVALGTALRHTMINHKTKGKDAWEELADLVYDFAKER